jgi:hypothetical protein
MGIKQTGRRRKLPILIMFTDEVNFYVNGEVNRRNLRYWSGSNPYWMSPPKMQDAGKLMV